MKNRNILLFVVALGISGSAMARFTTSRVVIDKIVARVNGRNILLSHLRQRRIDVASTYSLEEAIDHEFLFQKATERKLLPTNLDVEKHIVAWKQAHHLTEMTDDQFDERLRMDGLTIKQYRGQLARVISIRNLRQVVLSERVVITPHDVEQYHDSNPEYSDDRYLLRTKIVEVETNEEAIADKSTEWIDLDWIDHAALAERMRFVADLDEGAVSDPLKVEQGYQFVKVLKKEKRRLKTLEERWGAIEKLLQAKRIEVFEKKYVNELRKKGTVTYL